MNTVNGNFIEKSIPKNSDATINVKIGNTDSTVTVTDLFKKIGVEDLTVNPTATSYAGIFQIKYGSDNSIPIATLIATSSTPNSTGYGNIEIGGTAQYSTDNYFSTIVGTGASILPGAVNGATLLGYSATHRGNNGNGIGIGRQVVTDRFGVAIGTSGTQITGYYSTAIGGRGASVYGDYNIALGSYAIVGTTLAPKTQSIAIGNNSVSQYNNSIVFGYGTTATADNQITLGNSATTQTILKGTVQMPNLQLSDLTGPEATALGVPVKSMIISVSSPDGEFSSPGLWYFSLSASTWNKLN